MIPVRQTLSKPDVEISYLEWHQGQEPLLLLHGMGDHALVWLSLGEHLAADYHIVAPDMRGHGDSSKPEKDYSFESAIADLEALMDKLGWSTAHVVSHSWTGKLAVIWARQNPQRLRSITLIDPIFIWKMPSFLKITFPLLYRVLPFLKSMGPFASYEQAQEQIKQLSQYQSWNVIQQQVFQAGIEQKPNGTWGSKFTIAARDGIFAAVMEVPGFIGPIDTPALFIQPEKGVNRQNWQIQPYTTNLTNLELCRVPGNHWPFLTAPEPFNQTVAKFLATQTGNGH
ncbi:alpha/beta hydrolase fold protein [Richelia sinica FACHB-800]|uniref:Alpha/beta hydrolase fold protein n=1 Tax=Richelia sinica FACHB-800 TaxID=1357546 RepID=A0A975T9I1_9NOST|nr:alpha/beta hydrolase [Richelia sinica]MBD2667462.1 alpha/beta hydrolase [Richelia sinica FACHB-800]QXE23846.1 alpha/beta hydrolase fold protein [Richelia sinica FACHB-800]